MSIVTFALIAGCELTLPQTLLLGVFECCCMALSGWFIARQRKLLGR